MNIKVISGKIGELPTAAVVINAFENIQKPEGVLDMVDKSLNGAISQLITSGEIKGKFKEITSIFSFDKLPTKRVVIVGLGKRSELNPEKVRVAVGEACRLIREKSPENLNSVTFDFEDLDLNPAILGQSMAEGVLLGSYRFNKYLNQKSDRKEIQQINIMCNSASNIASFEEGCRRGTIIAQAAILARDMVNEPANVMTPAAMAEKAQQIAIQNNLEVRVLERDEMRNLGMGGLLGVSQGSQQPPKFIVINYKGKESTALDVALVGKGITFDSGGISIKPSENMGEMKGDMSGGASVIAAIGAIAQLKPEINVTAIIPATENLPSGTAMHPGDVITIMGGKTVEIVSTDAEGRLILADALRYACNLEAKRIVDVATLTGACHIALGNFCTGTFGNNQELVNRIIAAGFQAGECMWQMPMNEEYRELNKSDIADLKNSGGRYGGAITAAWFLREYVGDTPWVHLDIAGTFMADKDRGYQVKGATGIPVRTLINFVLGLAEK